VKSESHFTGASLEAQTRLSRMSENDSELARPQTKQSMADGSVVKNITVYTFVKKIPR